MSKKEFEKILMKNKKKNKESIDKIIDNCNQFDKKIKEILRFL